MWGREKRIEMISDRKIAAVYFGLMQSGYEYHAAGKSSEDVRQWESFRDMPVSYDTAFFRGARQTTTGIYPYAARAAALEMAAFYVDEENEAFINEEAYRSKLAASGLIKDREQEFFAWVKGFPKSMHSVMHCQGFARYMQWEENWLKHQIRLRKHEIQKRDEVVSYFMKRQDTAVKKVFLALCPLKCTFASDYVVENGALYAIAGVLRLDETMHEFYGHLLQPFVFKYGDEIAALRNLHRLKVEDSFFGDRKEIGRLNAFKEYAVRELTAKISIDQYKLDLDKFILSLIKPLADTLGPIG